MLQHPQERPKHPNSTPKNYFGKIRSNCTLIVRLESDTEQSADAFAVDAETAASSTAVPFKLASRVAEFCSFINSIYI